MMNVALIGAGNLMTNLGAALAAADDVSIRQVWSRTEASATALAEKLGVPSTTDLSAVADADVFIIAVKDSALETLVPILTSQHPEAVFLHTAGSMPMSLFEGFARHYGVLYPMQTFSKGKSVDFKEIPVFIEANDEKAFDVVNRLSKGVSDNVYELSSDKRRYLHLAAVFACNFVNHCYHLSACVLESQGIPFSVMLPLIDETARKVHQLSPHDAQTGPAVRYDENVIQHQMAMIDDEKVRQIYELLSKSIHDKL